MDKRSGKAAGIILTAVLILVSVFSGCNLGIAEEATGSLLVSFGAAARSFDTSLDEEIASYAVTLTHSKTAEEQSGEFAKGERIEFDKLTLGTWRVDVEGRNGAGTVVAEGWTNVDIVPNTRVTASVIVSRVDGNGTLNVTVSWADGALENPTVSLKLYDNFAMSGEPQDLTVSLTDADADEKIDGAAASQSVPAGSCILVLTVTDPDTNFSAGRFDVVHILASDTAETEVSYSVSVPTGTAGIIIEDPVERKEITLSAESLTSVPEVPLLFSTDDSSAETYVWGINGNVLTGETGPTLEYTFEESGNFVVSCMALFDAGAIASDSQEVQIGEFDPGTSAEAYTGAKAILDTAVSGSETVVNLNEAYALLNRAVALNPDNADAVLALAIMDLVGMLVDEEIVQVMRDGLGMSNYPEDYTGFYANMYSAVSLPAFYPTQSSLTANGYNNFLANYGDVENNFHLPLLSGLVDYQYTDGPNAYLLQMLENMNNSGRDLDDVFNGILQALGNSLDAVAGNLERLSEGGRFAVTGETFLADTFGFTGALYYTRSEAKLLAAMLYQVQSYAYLMKTVDLGFDISALLEGVSYNTATDELTVESGYTPFLNNFLQADADAAAVLAEAEAAMLTSLELMQEALAEIAGRTAEEDPAPEDALFLSPYNPMFGGDGNWEIAQDQLAFVGKYASEVEASITSETYYPAVLPVDSYNFNYADFFTWYIQNDFENWPSEPEGDLTSPPTAIGFSFGALFDPGTTLLAMLLELDADGDPTLYTYDQETFPVMATGEYDPTQYYYIRIPDITLNRFLSFPPDSALIEQLNNRMKYLDVTDLETCAYFEANNDGTVSLYLNLNIGVILNVIFDMLGSSLSTEPFAYPLAYHMLTEEGMEKKDMQVQVWFYYIIDTNVPSCPLIMFTIPMDLTSTGSFWSGFAEISKWVSLPIDEQYADLSLFESGTQADALELPIDSIINFRSWNWCDNNPFFTQNSGDDFWIKYTADQAGTVVINSYNSAWNVIDPAGNDLGEQGAWDGERLEVAKSDVFYIHISSLAADDALRVYCQYDDDLGDISSRDSAHELEENEVVTGRSGYGLPTDYFILAPATDAIRLTFTIPAEDAARLYSDVYFSIIEVESGSTSEDREYGYFDSTGTSVYDYTLNYTSPDAFYVSMFDVEGLDYTLKWEDVGDSL